MSKLVKYYYDFMSQPSRAIWIGLKLSKTDFEDCPVALRKLEQLSDEYKKINRFQKVPCIVDGDFHLSESIAIVRYLADKGQFSADLYPKELVPRTRVDEFLEWHHLGLRAPCALYFWHCWLLPMNNLAPPPSEETELKLRKDMEEALKNLEKFWLKNTEFVSGNKMTVADIMGASEIEQTKLLKYDVAKKFPRVAAWLDKIRETSNPHYETAHKFLYKKSGATSKI